MRRSFQRIGGVLITPRRAFAAIREEPHWGWVFLLAVVASSLLLHFSAPFLEHAYGYDSPGETASLSMAGRISAIALTGPILLLKWLFTSLPLFLLARPLAGGRFLFKQVYAAVAHAESVPLLENAANLLLLHAGGPETAATPGELARVPALGHAFRQILDNPALLSVLDQITPFQLWYVALLTIGLALTARCGRWSALTLAGGVWLLGAALRAALGVLAGEK